MGWVSDSMVPMITNSVPGLVLDATAGRARFPAMFRTHVDGRW
jgi:hypothetical protein